jgi:hypothetical protein
MLCRGKMWAGRAHASVIPAFALVTLVGPECGYRTAARPSRNTGEAAPATGSIEEDRAADAIYEIGFSR